MRIPRFTELPRNKAIAESGAPSAPSPDAGSIAREQKQIALKVLRDLRPGDREGLVRFYLTGQSEEQICADLGLTPTRFRLIKSRARRRFEELCAARLAPRPRLAVGLEGEECEA
jgi:DNA-directed RNA polymerase specialized sigma24 family protein